MQADSINRPSVAVAALGCKLSQAEGDAMAELLLEAGFCLKPFGNTVDVAIVHTCTVTETAGAKSRKLLGRARRSAEVVIAAGCHAVLDGEDLLQAGLADRIVRHEDECLLPTIICEMLGISLDTVASAAQSQAEMAEKGGRLERTRAFLPIQTGCNRQCTFCRIHLARGHSVSLPGHEVERLIARKIAQGYKEIVLAGVDLADWHEDGHDLADMLRYLLQSLPDDIRIRLSSLEPDIQLIKKLSNLMLEFPHKLARHLHLPLQSGSNAILAAMGRHYTAEDYHSLVVDVMVQLPDLCWGADVLAGFPGESDEDFLHTFSLLESLTMAYLHVFPFSARSGTPAAVLPHRVPSKIIQERVARLRQLSQQKWLDFRRAQIGKSARILVEGKPESERGAWGGRASNYVHVWGKGLEEMQNHWVIVNITEVYGNGLWGEVEGKVST
jgi:threonylcarbamoyladenosine tRNA methylthiotransferase MtaB